MEIELWVARDNRGKLTMHYVEPKWNEKQGYWWNGHLIGTFPFDYDFPHVTVKNSPQKVKLTFIQ